MQPNIEELIEDVEDRLEDLDEIPDDIENVIEDADDEADRIPRADENLIEVDDEMDFPVGNPFHQPHEISGNEEGTDTNL